MLLQCLQNVDDGLHMDEDIAIGSEETVSSSVTENGAYFIFLEYQI